MPIFFGEEKSLDQIKQYLSVRGDAGVQFLKQKIHTATSVELDQLINLILENDITNISPRIAEQICGSYLYQDSCSEDKLLSLYMEEHASSSAFFIGLCHLLLFSPYHNFGFLMLAGQQYDDTKLKPYRGKEDTATKAGHYLKLAAECGNLQAYYWFYRVYGVLLFYTHVPSHEAQYALAGLKKAADGDIVEAAFAYGRILQSGSTLNGFQVPVDEKLAEHYLEKALQLGYGSAQRYLDELRDKPSAEDSCRAAARLLSSSSTKPPANNPEIPLVVAKKKTPLLSMLRQPRYDGGAQPSDKTTSTFAMHR